MRCKSTSRNHTRLWSLLVLALVTTGAQAAEVIRDLVAIYRRDTGLLPHHVQARFEMDGEFRAIADYVAGMTDRFALDECARLRGSNER
jgi:dGTPase